MPTARRLDESIPKQCKTHECKVVPPLIDRLTASASASPEKMSRVSSGVHGAACSHKADLSGADCQGFSNALEWAGKGTCASLRSPPTRPLAPSSLFKHPLDRRSSTDQHNTHNLLDTLSSMSGLHSRRSPLPRQVNFGTGYSLM